MQSLQEFLVSDALLTDSISTDTEIINTLEHVVDRFLKTSLQQQQKRLGTSALDLVPMDTDNNAFGDVVRVWLCVCVCVCVYLCVYVCV